MLAGALMADPKLVGDHEQRVFVLTEEAAESVKSNETVAVSSFGVRLLVG
jgi:hypothetical protein